MNPNLTKARKPRQQHHATNPLQTDAASVGDAETKKPATARINLSELDPDSYLRLKQIVPGIVPVNPGTWWKWVKEGKAPAGQKLGPATTAWRVRDLRAFLAQRSAA